VRFAGMHYTDRVIEAAISTARNLLSQNLGSTRSLYVSDAETVSRIRELVYSPSVRSALESGSDMLPAFALREVDRVVKDQSLTDHQIITWLWEVLDEPHLKQALGISQNSRMTFGPSPKRR
jgi:hypothetical protein